MKKWILILPFVLSALVACAPGTEPENDENVAETSPVPTESPLAEVEAATEPPSTDLLPPTAVPTDTPPAEPTTIPTTEPTSQPTNVPSEEPAAETAVITGRTDEGVFFLGAPNAPVTMIDYSDFL
jgi:hypothetical protein